MMKIKLVSLHGTWIDLEPLSEKNKEAVFHAAQTEHIWADITGRSYLERFNNWYDYAILQQQQGNQLVFVVRKHEDQQVLGSTRYYDVSISHRRLSIGYTWYIPEVWGGYVNPECKYLMLQHAFEVLHANRVEFVTDAKNVRARAALLKLGAVEEGILRHHLILENGCARDTVIFSIIHEDWPKVKKNLQQRLQVFSEPMNEG